MPTEALQATYLGRDVVSCIACNHRDGRTYSVMEMMFRTGSRFQYFECDACGCLQLVDPPDDFKAYYPEEYYSFSQQPVINQRLTSLTLRQRLSFWRNEAQLFGGTAIGRLLARCRPREDVAAFRQLFSPTSVQSLDAPILDVGCGTGALLRDLHEIGFRRLTGIDPFLSSDLVNSPSLRILSTDLHSLRNERFDLIMFHHSLEHIHDQRETFELISQMLTSSGVCLIRIPTASSELWQLYREHWVELDAPRHTVLHTTKSLDLLLRRAGLERFYSECDSTGFAYWGSELYRRGMSLIDHPTRQFREPASVFSRDELDGFEDQARVANAKMVGSRAAFYTRRAK